MHNFFRAVEKPRIFFLIFRHNSKKISMGLVFFSLSFCLFAGNLFSFFSFWAHLLPWLFISTFPTLTPFFIEIRAFCSLISSLNCKMELHEKKKKTNFHIVILHLRFGWWKKVPQNESTKFYLHLCTRGRCVYVLDASLFLFIWIFSAFSFRVDFWFCYWCFLWQKKNTWGYMGCRPRCLKQHKTC